MDDLKNGQAKSNGGQGNVGRSKSEMTAAETAARTTSTTADGVVVKQDKKRTEDRHDVCINFSFLITKVSMLRFL